MAITFGGTLSIETSYRRRPVPRRLATRDWIANWVPTFVGMTGIWGSAPALPDAWAPACAGVTEVGVGVWRQDEPTDSMGKGILNHPAA